MMQFARFGAVYRITCDTNGKVYIGLTRAYVSDRWYQHKKAALDGKSSALYQAMRKHGTDNFRIEHIASAVTPDALGWLERYLIAEHGSIGRAGYNMSLGGEQAFERRMTDEGKAKIRSARNRPEALAANRERNAARMKTAAGVELQARMVVAARAASGKLSASRARYAATPEGRAQIVAAGRAGAARKAAVSGKPVVADGVQFRSVADAAAAHGVERGAVRYRIKSPGFDSWAWA